MESVPGRADIDLLVSVVGRGDEFIAGEDRYLLSDDGGDWTPLTFDLDGFYGDWRPIDISQRYILGVAQKTDAPDADRYIVRYDRSSAFGMRLSISDLRY